ncbi:MAG: hypothetical protein UY97_C0010G0009 [Parcubacteria group bacterium GW2011_GWB1_57_6]|nr:MAG: hypothetical protein UY93_C0002G0369 [Parcubacteria group bacterium GW2011_GWA1_56_13]KKW46086.1 MAG: hypothetical protein UY97_C0010G0009 [Parcubacteria group bacterium GW2011_GWB1_57_6]
MVRVPGPNEFEIDGKPQESTHDIIGLGQDEEEAFEDIFSKYLAVRETVMTPRKRLAEQTKYIFH